RTPDWVKAQASVALPSHEETADAVVLYTESQVTVQSSGKVRRLERRVYRILRPEGKARANLSVIFNTSRDSVRSMHAWCIPTSGKDYEGGDRGAVETAPPGAEFVTDLRARVLTVPAALPGNLIAFEVERDEQPVLAGAYWSFQDTVPVREAHYRLE